MDAKEFYLDTPLYLWVRFDTIEDLNKIVTYNCWEDIHGYNPIHKMETTFTLCKKYSSIPPKTIVPTDPFFNTTSKVKFDLELYCLRTDEKFYFSGIWDGPNMSLIKIGQYPSLADFHISQIKQYDKILNKSKLKEFTKAIGLAANGVGIGSFVYLRRIFEGLIYEAASEMNSNKVFNEELFKKMRIPERIVYLSHYLPEFLVKHKELYSILSLGIHELDEEVCLQHFDVVKVGIEFILDEKLEKHIKKQKIEEASAKIKSVASTIKPTQP